MIEFVGVVRFDEDGEVICFCSSQACEADQCVCMKNNLAKPALISITLLEKDLDTAPVRVDTKLREVLSSSKNISRDLNNINKKLQKLRLRRP